MSENDNGRPPVPGTDETASQPTVQRPATAPAGAPQTAGAAQTEGAQSAAGTQGAYGVHASASQHAGSAGTHAGTGASGGAGVPGGPGEPGGQTTPAGGADGHKKHKEHKGHGLRNALLGLCGGVVGAILVILALNFVVPGSGGDSSGSETSDSSAGQTINITTSGEDATVAQAAAAKALPSVVVVNVTTDQGSGLGSGVIYDEDGDIITNYHVIEDATAISVTIDNKSYDASVVGSDPSSDIAVIKVDLGDTKVTPIEVGDSDKLTVGDWVMTVGSPFGLDQSVSAGIVSSLSRNQMMESTSGNTIYTNLIQTDAAINPGNSGGALVNSEGQLVGICTLFSSDTESFAGIGFAIPGNYATKIADTIIAGKTVTHAYIGLTMQTVNAQNATQNDLSVNQGAYVADVTEGSPADEAGIEKGDIITAVDGEDITSADGMILAVRSHDIGDTIKVTFMRGDDEKTVEVTLGDDAELQKQQQEEAEQEQQQTEGYGLNGNGTGDGSNGSGNGYSQDDLLQEIYEYLYNNRGGSYDTSEGVSGQDA